MFRMTQLIYQTLRSSERGLKVFTEDNGGQSEVWLAFKVDNGGSYQIKFISKDDDSDVAVRVFGLINIQSKYRDKILPAINEANNKFRFVKFVLDDDGDVNVEYDFPVSANNVEDSAVEIIGRFNAIIDEVYPILMRALYA